MQPAPTPVLVRWPLNPAGKPLSSADDFTVSCTPVHMKSDITD